MKSASLNDLLKLLSTYSEEEVDKIKRAYNYAYNLHRGQYRQSGEEYIVHPLTVGYILAEMHADVDTICAGLLHDTLEDTKATKEEIAENFGSDVANLVDGVTKISKMNFSSKQEQNVANTRKIITSISNDIRIIIIKLADRLHNMRTLEFKSEFKQKENSVETMEIFVPIAYQIGAYRIKSELEDLSLQYLEPNIYKNLQEKIIRIEEESNPCIQEMLFKINKILNDRNIPNEIKIRTKNIYGIYKRLYYQNHQKLSDIHDLISFKIMVDEIDTCYLLLRPIHESYKPVNSKFKDYICNPKTNMYQSLHTTVFGPDSRLIQMQIRTFDMDKIASFGLPTYWAINKDEARERMQADLRSKYQFYNSLLEINQAFGDNLEFVNQVKRELFSEKVYVYTTKGETIELPKGSTPIDFAYQISRDLGNTMFQAVVNDKNVPVDYELKNKDRVRIITDDLSFGPKSEWIDKVKTTKAKRMIKEFIRG